MKLCIYGAGAVGGVMAGWLARAGNEVSLVARGAQLEAIRRSGLRVRSNGAVETFAVRAESDPRELGPQDYVVVTVKAQTLSDVAQTITPLLGAQTSIATAMTPSPRC